MTAELDDLELFRELVETRDRQTRNRLVERHMGLAIHISKRFARTAARDDDLRQVAMVGLVKAVDRFDPEYGASFTSFAGRTIEGELKRYLRDASWAVKVPRSAKELHLLVRRATGELEQRLGTSPDVDQLAAHLGIDREDVVRGLAVSAVTTVDTIEGPSNNDAASAHDALETDDLSLVDVENAQVVDALMRRLPAREREIVRLRFYEQKTQSEIADVVGLSQMHVSRLLRDSFALMREWAGERDDVDDPAMEAR
jgi:RNA polymerase sigma-B factor